MGTTMRKQAALLAALGLTRCLAAAAAEPRDAQAAGLFQPIFHAASATVEAGKAFVVQPEGCAHPVLLTALRLLGPVGGMPAQLGARELPDRLYDITVESIGRPGLRMSMNAINLTPPGALPCCASRSAQDAGDMAAFEAPDSLAAVALPLAARLPAIGEHLHVLTPMGKGNARRLRHEVVLQSIANGYLLFEFVPADLLLEVATGAPLLNGAGEVVAINIGRESTGQGIGRGIGNPTVRWLEPLRGQCQRP
jgi:hypothetical protein